jgi:hypothetical protein
MDQEPHTLAPIVEFHEQVARLLGYPGRVRVSGDTEDRHPPGVKLDGEKDVECLQEDRLHGEEVDREDALCLGTQELAPGGTARAGRRTETTCS